MIFSFPHRCLPWLNLAWKWARHFWNGLIKQIKTGFFHNPWWRKDEQMWVKTTFIVSTFLAMDHSDPVIKELPTDRTDDYLISDIYSIIFLYFGSWRWNLWAYTRLQTQTWVVKPIYSHPAFWLRQEPKVSRCRSSVRASVRDICSGGFLKG